MQRLRHVDRVTASELKNMQEVLVSKETEVVQSESTARGLTTGQSLSHSHTLSLSVSLTHTHHLNTPTVLHSESQRLQQDLEKVQQLEGKITSELSTLKERISTMEAELLTYRDLDALRRTAEERKLVTQL